MFPEQRLLPFLYPQLCAERIEEAEPQIAGGLSQARRFYFFSRLASILISAEGRK
jgi:hypothetical protein